MARLPWDRMWCTRLTPFRTLILPVQCASLLVAGFGPSPGRAAESGAVPDGWFAWPSVEPVSGTAVDVSALNAKPAGAAGRILVKDGHFATPDGRRVNFWGCNLSAEVAFPPVDELPALARRLAKGGVNIARLHHLDNEWAVNRGGSLWPEGRKNHEQVDPGQLDRVFRLVAALKAEGIYSNLNLKVSRSLVPADGFPDTVRELPMFQKRVDIFDRRMIELQKAFARQLLTTKNPHTGLTLAEDPAVAVIEMNNENSLLGFWTRDLGRGLDRLPEPWRRDLTKLWNTWLGARHGDDDALRAAWRPSATADSGNVNALPAAATWLAKTTAAAEFQIAPGKDATAFEILVTKVSGTDWHAQAQVLDLPIVDGDVYTISFLARADQPRMVGVGVGLDLNARPGESWRSFGLLDSASIGTEWTPVRFGFAAHSANGAPGALQLSVGQHTGTIAIKDFMFTRGAEGTGLQPGQSLREGTVPIPTLASKTQWADWIHFLADTERAYADEMRSFLKDELGVVAPMICSQIEYGGLTGVYREQNMDFADTHAYWEHPDIENGDFDGGKWTIANSPQVAVMGPRGFGELGSRALMRIAGKPFAVSEYDHSAPSEYACEMYPTLATFAARQDWDALYPFDIGLTGSRNPDGTIGRFFDQLNHPAKWGFGPFAALVFRNQLVHRATWNSELQLGTLPWTIDPHSDLAWAAVWPEGVRDQLNARFAISDRPGETDVYRGVTQQGGPLPPPLTLTMEAQGQVYVVNSPRAAGAVGFLGGATINADALRVTCERFGNEFAAVTAVALDQQSLLKSKRILVTIVARAQNQGIVWNAERNSTGETWGHGPPIVERVPATITLTSAAGAKVFALAPDGTRARRVKTTKKNGDLTFSVSAADKTIHYEIVR